MPSLRTKFTDFIKQFGPKADVIVPTPSPTNAIGEGSGACVTATFNGPGANKLVQGYGTFPVPNYLGGAIAIESIERTWDWKGRLIIAGYDDPLADVPANMREQMEMSRRQQGFPVPFQPITNIPWASDPIASLGLNSSSAAIDFGTDGDREVPLLTPNLCQYVLTPLNEEGSLDFNVSGLNNVSLASSPNSSATSSPSSTPTSTSQETSTVTSPTTCLNDPVPCSGIDAPLEAACKKSCGQVLEDGSTVIEYSEQYGGGVYHKEPLRQDTRTVLTSFSLKPADLVPGLYSILGSWDEGWNALNRLGTITAKVNITTLAYKAYRPNLDQPDHRSQDQEITNEITIDRSDSATDTPAFYVKRTMTSDFGGSGGVETKDIGDPSFHSGAFNTDTHPNRSFGNIIVSAQALPDEDSSAEVTLIDVNNNQSLTIPINHDLEHLGTAPINWGGKELATKNQLAAFKIQDGSGKFKLIFSDSNNPLVPFSNGSMVVKVEDHDPVSWQGCLPAGQIDSNLSDINNKNLYSVDEQRRYFYECIPLASGANELGSTVEYDAGSPFAKLNIKLTNNFSRANTSGNVVLFSEIPMGYPGSNRLLRLVDTQTDAEFDETGHYLKLKFENIANSSTKEWSLRFAMERENTQLPNRTAFKVHAEPVGSQQSQENILNLNINKLGKIVINKVSSSYLDEHNSLTRSEENKLYPGSLVEYKVSYQHPNSAALEDVNFKLAIPDFASFSSGDSGINYDSASHLLTWHEDRVNPEQTVTKTINLKYDNEVPYVDINSHNDIQTFNLTAYMGFLYNINARPYYIIKSNNKEDIWQVLKGRITNAYGHPVPNASLSLLEEGDPEVKIGFRSAASGYQYLHDILVTDNNGEFKLMKMDNPPISSDVDGLVTLGNSPSGNNFAYKDLEYTRKNLSPRAIKIEVHLNSTFSAQGIPRFEFKSLVDASNNDVPFSDQFAAGMTLDSYFLGKDIFLRTKPISLASPDQSSRLISQDIKMNRQGAVGLDWEYPAAGSSRLGKITLTGFETFYNYFKSADILKNIGFDQMNNLVNDQVNVKFTVDRPDIISNFSPKVGDEYSTRNPTIILSLETVEPCMKRNGGQELHEFSHLIQNLVNPNIVTGSGNVSHNGYLNNSSSDSFVEGSALFFAQYLTNKIQGNNFNSFIDTSIYHCESEHYNSLLGDISQTRPITFDKLFENQIYANSEELSFASLLWRIFVQGYSLKESSKRDYTTIPLFENLQIMHLSSGIFTSFPLLEPNRYFINFPPRFSEPEIDQNVKFLLDLLSNHSNITDFLSFYQGLKNQSYLHSGDILQFPAFPEINSPTISLDQLDQMFLMTGIFKDNNGDFRYRLGEEIGKSGNSVNFRALDKNNRAVYIGPRPSRQLPPNLPAIAIKLNFSAGDKDLTKTTSNFTVTIQNENNPTITDSGQLLSGGILQLSMGVVDYHSRIIITAENSSQSLVIPGEEFYQTMLSSLENNNNSSQATVLNFTLDNSTPPTPEQAIKQYEDNKAQEQARLTQSNPAYTQLTQEQQAISNEQQAFNKQISDLEAKLKNANLTEEQARELRNQLTNLRNQSQNKEQSAEQVQIKILDTAFQTQPLMTPQMKASLEENRQVQNQGNSTINQAQQQLNIIQVNQQVDIALLNKNTDIKNDPCVLDALVHSIDPKDIREKQNNPACAQKVEDYNKALTPILDNSAKAQEPIVVKINQQLTKSQDQQAKLKGQSTKADFIDSTINTAKQTANTIKQSTANVVNKVKEVFKSKNKKQSFLIGKARAQTPEPTTGEYKISKDQATVKDSTPSIILYQLATDQTQQPLSNNTLDSANNTLIIEAHNFVNTRNYQLYLDNTFQSEGKVLGDGFAVKLTLPKTLKPGSHTITLLGDATNEQAQTTFTLTKNSYLTQRYWAIGIIATALILLVVLIIMRVRMKKKPVINMEIA